MSVVGINTSQNVNINFTVASIAERLLATFFDILIQVIYAWMMLLLLFGGLKVLGSFGSLASPTFILFIVVVGLPVLFYHLITEYFFKGRSFGKMIMGIRVVMLDGSEPGFLHFFLRWILRIIDISVFGGVVALVAIVSTGKGQRIGDKAAGTTVIRPRKKTPSITSASDFNLPEDYEPIYPEAINLKDKDVALIKEAIGRNQREIIVAVSAKVQDILQIEPKGDHLDFLHQVVKDYNFLAGRLS